MLATPNLINSVAVSADISKRAEGIGPSATDFGLDDATESFSARFTTARKEGGENLPSNGNKLPTSTDLQALDTLGLADITAPFDVLDVDSILPTDNLGGALLPLDLSGLVDVAGLAGIADGVSTDLLDDDVTALSGLPLLEAKMLTQQAIMVPPTVGTVAADSERAIATATVSATVLPNIAGAGEQLSISNVDAVNGPVSLLASALTDGRGGSLQAQRDMALTNETRQQAANLLSSNSAASADSGLAGQDRERSPGDLAPLSLQRATSLMNVAQDAQLSNASQTFTARLDAALQTTVTPQQMPVAAANYSQVPTPAAQTPLAAGSASLLASISTPVTDANWGQQVSERVQMMASGHHRTAEIRLTPADMGPLRVQIAIEDGQTNVIFQSHHAATRDALDLALPRLRELLAEQGLTLGEASVSEQDVSAGDTSEQFTDAKGSTDVDGENGVGAASIVDATEIRSRTVSRGLLDTFA